MYPIDFFWRAAQRWPDRTAIDAPEGPIRFDALAAQVRALAAALTAIDPTPQSRVGICAHNSAGHIAMLLAVLACGKVWVPLNPKSTRPEIRRIIDATEPSILVQDAGSADLLDGAPGARIHCGFRHCGEIYVRRDILQSREDQRIEVNALLVVTGERAAVAVVQVILAAREAVVDEAEHPVGQTLGERCDQGLGLKVDLAGVAVNRRNAMLRCFE